jgi:hypothetical protein
MKLRHKLAAISSAVALAAAMGVVWAGSAAAADDQSLCAYTPDGYICAIDTSPVLLSSGESYDWNTPSSKTGQISLYNGGAPGVQCMQVDASMSNRIVLASCAGKASEEWEPVSEGGGEYSYYNADTNLCLNAHYQVDQLNAAPCNYLEDQEWYPTP